MHCRKILIAGTCLILAVAVAGCTSGQDAPNQDTGSAAARDQASPEKPTVDADTQLREACFDGKKAAVLSALESGADVNAPDEERRTPVMLAAFNGHEEIVELLLGRKANVNDRDAAGRTALMYAASGPNLKTVQLLLDKKAEVDVQDGQEHWTALMFAAAEGQADVVELLLKYKANASLTDVDGDTAIDFAQQKGHSKVVGLLTQGPQ